MYLEVGTLNFKKYLILVIYLESLHPGHKT